MPKMWNHGPDFLLQHKHRWALDVPMSHEVSLDDPEVKRVTSNMIVTVAAQDNHPIDQMINYYSDYYRLKKAVAWLVRWVRLMRHDKDVDTGLLTLSEFRNAECILIKRDRNGHERLTI